MHPLLLSRARVALTFAAFSFAVGCSPDESSPAGVENGIGVGSGGAGAPTDVKTTPTTPTGGGASSSSGGTGGGASMQTVTPPAGGGNSASGLPCDVKKVVETHCGGCHSDPPTRGAFMALTSQAHFQKQGTTDPSKKYHQLAKTRINAATSPMPPVSEPRLSADELSTLNAWLDKGAPASTEVCAPSTTMKPPSPPDEGPSTEGLECHKFLAHAPGDQNTKYKVGTAVDKYINFGFKAPWPAVAYGIVVKPVIDNAKVLHHWLLYREDAEDLSVNESNGQHTFGELIHGWAPGGESLDFRKHGDVSFELEPSSYVVEVHYNSADPDAADSSGVEVCFQRTPTKNIAGLSWVGYDQGIEAYTAGALLGTEFSEVCLDPQATWTGTCAPENPDPIHILFVVPHMHKAGVHMTSVINGPNGQRMLHDAPFDFSSQIGYSKNELLMPGETITTTCKFSEPKCAGHATTAEMCYLFTYAWPKGALHDSGLWGQVAHGNGACLGQ